MQPTRTTVFAFLLERQCEQEIRPYRRVRWSVGASIRLDPVATNDACFALGKAGGPSNAMQRTAPIFVVCFVLFCLVCLFFSIDRRCNHTQRKWTVTITITTTTAITTTTTTATTITTLIATVAAPTCSHSTVTTQRIHHHTYDIATRLLSVLIIVLLFCYFASCRSVPFVGLSQEATPHDSALFFLRVHLCCW